MKKYYSLFLFFSLNFYFSQQAESLKLVKEKYDAEIQKINNKYTDDIAEAPLRKHAKITLKKDSDIGTLELKRNNEYLEKLEKIKSGYILEDFQLKTDMKDTEEDKSPKYPDGIEAFKKEIAENLNTNLIRGKGIIQSRVVFIIDLDGSIMTAKAFGENESFNKQAELAILLIKKKWEPAKKNNQPYRTRLRVPLTLTFD